MMASTTHYHGIVEEERGGAMSLDLRLGRALRSALVLERALAERDGWSFELGGLRIPAARLLQEDGVVFQTHTPDMDFPVDPEFLSLYWREEIQLVRPFDGARDHCLSWALSLPEPVVA